MDIKTYAPLMHEALKEAEAARDDGDWAIGCVVALNNVIIARGRNRVNSQRDRLAHAEMLALRDLQAAHFDHIHNKDMVVVTTFEPCVMCFGGIILNGIRTVVSGVNLDASGSSALANSMPEYFQQQRYQTTLITGVLARDCAEMWASGQAAKNMLANGYRLPSRMEDLTNDDAPRTYITASGFGPSQQGGLS